MLVDFIDLYLERVLLMGALWLAVLLYAIMYSTLLDISILGLFSELMAWSVGMERNKRQFHGQSYYTTSLGLSGFISVYNANVQLILKVMTVNIFI